MCPHGSPWVLMGSHGFPWAPHGPPWGPWAPLGPPLESRYALLGQKFRKLNVQKTYCRCKEYLAKTICCAILPQIVETHSTELSDHQNTQNLMADSIFGVPGARNHQKQSNINFAHFLSSPSTPGPNLAPMDLCGIFLDFLALVP